MTGFASAPPTSFDAESAELLEAMRSSPLIVLCGRNNSGKSFVLRHLLRMFGEGATYLGPARYQNFQTLGVYSAPQSRKSERFQQLINQFFRNTQNVDNSPLNFSEALAELSDAEREKLFGLLKRLLDADVSVEQAIPGNSMSQRYVRVNGYNLAFQSSGFRLAATLLACLFNQDHSTFIVDEPELGLSPEAQGIISDFLFDPRERAEHFPHLTRVVLATHSPLFIDRKNVENNFFVSRNSTQISLRRLRTVQDINELQLLLLGNRLETLHLPSAIVLVEGPCDHVFLNRLVNLRFPKASISVIHCSGDSRIKEHLSVVRQTLGDLQRSPYADRIFVVLDSVHEKSMPAQLVAMGIAAKNVIIWTQNGIEFLYPRELLERKFGTYETLEISGDVIEHNGVSAKKKELADFIASRMTGDEALPEELEEKLLAPLQKLVSA
jgi:predicted ATP-dependent endonuclease of OLD family